MARSKLMFPNPKKPDAEPQKQEKQEVAEDVGKDIGLIEKRVALLEKEKTLMAERDKRLKKRHHRMSEASMRKEMRKRQAIAMRMRNIPVDTIAERLHIDNAYAAKLIREAVSELPEETAGDLKKLLGRTVVQLIGNFERTALEGDVRCADVMLKAIEKLMKLSGLSIQKREIETSNVGEVSPGIDVADLHLDLDTKRKILSAIRENKKLQELQESKDETTSDDRDVNPEEAD